MEIGLHTTLLQDKKLIWYRGDSVRYVVAEIEAPPASGSEGKTTEPIAIVFDASELAKRTAVHAGATSISELLDRLPTRDRVFLIAYSGRDQGVVESIVSGWGTAAPRLEVKPGLGLVDAWLYGAELAARSIEGGALPQARVIILQTSTDPEAKAFLPELGHIARGLEARGVVTTAIGIGPEVDLPCLIALDQYHGQQQLYAETPAEIAHLLTTNVLNIYPVVAADAAISIVTPTGVDVCPIDQFDQPSTGRTSVVLGEVRAGAKKLAIFKLRFSAGDIGEQEVIKVQTAWRLMGEDRKQHSSHALTFEFAPGRINSPQPIDNRAALLVTQAWRNAILWYAYQLISDGRSEEADRFIKKETLHLERYSRAQNQLRSQLVLLAEGLRTLGAA